MCRLYVFVILTIVRREWREKGKVKWETGWSLTRLILDEIPDESARLTSNLNYLVSIEVTTFIQIGGIALLEVLGIQNVMIYLILKMRWII